MHEPDPMERERTEHRHFVEQALADLERYFRHSNEILGMSGFVLALSAAQLDASSFYGWLCLLFLVAVWFNGFQSYRKKMHTLLANRHPRIKTKAVLRQTWIALTGMAFVAAVALNLLDQNGLGVR